MSSALACALFLLVLTVWWSLRPRNRAVAATAAVVAGRKHPSRDATFFFGPKFGKKKRKTITSHDVLEFFKTSTFSIT